MTLVARDELSNAVSVTELAPYTDLRSILVAAREARTADGWDAGEIGKSCTFFFAMRNGVRHMVSIERRDPRTERRGLP